MSGVVEMKREPMSVEEYAELQRSSNGDLAAYRHHHQMTADRSSETTLSVCSQTSPTVSGRTPVTAFPQPGTPSVVPVYP